MLIQVRDESFFLHPSKALIWPKEKLLIVADIHLGKAQTFLKNGLWLPPQAHTTDLKNLANIIDSFSVNHVLFLGDFIHSVEGVTPTVIEEFTEWKKSFLGKITVIIGNHDRPFMHLWPPNWDFIERAEQIKIKDFIFQHEPPEKKQSEFVWCGHIHPKISLRHAGDHLYLPAFIVTPTTGYLPAYSSLAGGAHFPFRKTNRYFVSSNDQKVIEVEF